MSTHSMRLLGDVADDVIARLRRKILGRVPNDPRLEWMFDCLLGKEKPEQKRLILQARHPSVGFLTDADADVLISALVLEDA